MAKERNKILDFFGFGNNDEIEDENEYFEEEENYPKRHSREQYEEETSSRSVKRPRVVAVNNNDRQRTSKSSVIIYSPKNYNEAQPLVMHLIQHKHVIVKLDKVDKRVAQRILDFMSGAAYASDAQVTEVSKGSIYLFASSQTYIDTIEESTEISGDEGFTIDDEF